MLNLNIECRGVQYCCDYSFVLTIQDTDKNHVKVRIIEFVQIDVEIILLNCLKNFFYRMVTQQINKRDRYRTDLCIYII